MDQLHLDDLSVGQRFVSGTHTVDVAEIQRFAAAYDPQPFHLDDEAARNTLFGGLAASGWHTAGVTMRLLVSGGLPIAGGIIGSGGELLWTKPVRPGDTLRVECEILEIAPSRSRPDRGTVTVRCVTLNQHGEMVQSFTPKLVVPRRA
jgi:acyl dehydratase